MTHPYENLQDFQHWMRAVAWPAPGAVDPAVGVHKIGSGEKIATMGSCFAQHMARHLSEAGMTHHVAEPPPPALAANTAAARNYGVYSARYGNIYTVRQAVQLFDRAFGLFSPGDSAWTKGARFIDPFRPMVEPEGFSTETELLADRDAHLRCVRALFTDSDWLIFTLGLTEAWRSKRDGAIYPLAPGVAGGQFDAAVHEFVNFTVGEVREDLAAFVRKARSVNPDLKIILTISPVPLMATYEPRHVLVSTCVSKAILRCAADEIERHTENLFYFPSYEIVTSPSTEGRYYADDLRQVNEVGVGHVMRLFRSHFFEYDRPPPLHPDERIAPDIVCEEEVFRHARDILGPSSL